MNDTTTLVSPWRSIVAVVTGLLITALTTVVIDTILAATGIFPPGSERWPDHIFAFMLLYRIPIELAGGYVTAKLAPGKPLTHVLILAGLVAAGTSISAIVMHAERPIWYLLGLIAIAVPCSLLGERLQRRSRT